MNKPIEESKLIEEINKNEIEILKQIILYGKEFNDEFFLNEENIRNNKNEGEELEKEKKIFNTKQDCIINKISWEFKKHKSFLDLEELENKNVFLNDEIINNIIEDYFILYLEKKFDSDYLYLKKILHLILKLRFGNEKINFLKKLSRTIIYLESNSQYIYIILEMLNLIFKYNDNHYELMEKIINDNKINYEISETNPECKKEVNYSYFIIFESMIQSIFNKEFFDNIDEAKCFEFIKVFNNLLPNFNILEMNLRLFSKNIFQIKIFVKVSEVILEKNIENNENNINGLKLFINLMKKEIEILNEKINIEKNIEILNNILEEEYQFIKNKFKDKTYHQLILEFLGIKLKQIQNEKYHKKIMEIILSEREFIIKGQSILSLILDKNKISPKIGNEDNKEELKEKYLSFTKKENSLLEIFEKEKNGENSVIIDEILLYLFESYVNSYFDSIKGNEELIIKETLFGLSLEYLNKSLIFIDTILKQKDNILYEHLGFLLSVAYSKCYLVRLVDIIMNDKTLIIAGNLEIIMKTIEGNDKNKFRYVLKIRL